MRIVRSRIESCATCSDGDRPVGDHPCRITAAIEGRLVLNRVDTKLLGVALRVREQWHEQVIWAVARARCRLFGTHGVTCQGRADHRRRVFTPAPGHRPEGPR